MRHLAALVALLALLPGPNTAGAQPLPGGRPAAGGLGPLPPAPGSIDQRLDALEAETARLTQRVNDLTDALRSAEARSHRTAVREAHLDTSIPGQLGRPLPPGRDVVETWDAPPVRAGGGFDRGFGWGYPYPAGGLGGYGRGGPPDFPGEPLDPTAGVAAPAGPPSSGAAAPAKVTVLVPGRARVWFDGKEAATGSGHATFTSSPIPGGRGVTLSVRAAWDGSTYELSLPMRPGDDMTVDLRGK